MEYEGHSMRVMRTPGKRKPRAGMNLNVCFRDDSVLDDWLRSGAPMPESCPLSHFGSSERPVRKREFRIDDRARFEHYLKNDSIPTLFGATFRMFGFIHRDRPSRLGFYDYERRSDRGTVPAKAKSLTACAEEVLRYFAALGAVFGYACTRDESHARHEYRYNEGGEGGFRTELGRDFERYVPGLYWMTYFSREYASRHAVDLQAIADETNGKLIEIDTGVMLRLYRYPKGWEASRDVVEAAIDRRNDFFSIRKVEKPKEGLSHRESLQACLELSRDWR